MNLLEKIKLPMSETRTGNFGKVAIDTELTDLFFDGEPAIKQDITRFSNDEVLIAKFTVISSLDNLKKTVTLQSEVKVDEDEEKLWELYIFFNKHLNNFYFSGHIGSVANVRMYNIISDIFARLEARTLEICNPDIDYSLNDIVDVLRDAENPLLHEWIQKWDGYIDKPQAHQKKLVESK